MQLAVYTVTPFVELWRQRRQGMPEQPALMLPQPSTIFSVYVRLTITPALLAVLPLLTLMSLGLASPRALAAVKTRARAFLSASYAVIALGAFVTARFVVPPAFMELLSRLSWDPSQRLEVESYVAFLTFGVGGVCLNLELGLATVFVRIARPGARRD
jgi:Sec-independent protein secretion pathway component TatC